jgi:diguanylate cyclase (GGDEF)-like protein
MPAARQSGEREIVHYDPLMRATAELSLHAVELANALRHDDSVLRRHAVVSQRRARMIGAVVLAVLAVVSSGGAIGVALAAALVVAVYVAGVWVASRAIADEQRADASHRTTIHLLLGADVLAASVLCFLAGPDSLGRILVAGAVIAIMAAFYFGLRTGGATATAIALAYTVSVIIARTGLGVTRPEWIAAAVNVVLFSFFVAAAVRLLGAFRFRLNALRMYCKLGELGEPASAIPIDTARIPDDLTLLAGSFDDMRTKLAEQIGSDPLTGCANRRSLQRRLLADWRLAKRRNTSVALAAIDIDHFKQINDTRGHPVGDLVLQQIASIMLSTARDTDTVARLGGDEFLIVLPDTDFEGAVAFAERLRNRVLEFTFGPPSAQLAITISIGVAIGAGAAPIEPDQLMSDADRSLYRAKSDGRNRVCA